jgi:glycine hydroxymethyltransferase
MSTKLQQLEQQEVNRRNETLNLIASENYAWPEVRAALSSVFIDKYAEGAPHRRFYAGCNGADELELYAAGLTCKLFGAEYANLQAHSGSSANQIAYAAFLVPGDRVLAMSMEAGGHLTHGSKASLVAQIYNFVHYGLDTQTETIDYQQLEQLAKRHRPRLIVAGASAYPRRIDFAKIAGIAQAVGAFFMADVAHIAGLIAAGLHPSPVGLADVVTMTTQKTLRGPRGGIILAKLEHAKRIERAVMPGVQGGAHFNTIMAKAVMLERALQPEFCAYQQQIVTNAQAMAEIFVQHGLKLISGGTDNHLILMDVYQGGAKTGKAAEELLESIGITASRNLIPSDSLNPTVASGIRFGTPALTTRGMETTQAQELAEIIVAALQSSNADLKELAVQVQALASRLTKV